MILFFLDYLILQVISKQIVMPRSTTKTLRHLSSALTGTEVYFISLCDIEVANCI